MAWNSLLPRRERDARTGTKREAIADAIHRHFRNQPVGSIGKEVSITVIADKKQMHAEHANSDRLNDLSGRLIGCALTVLNTLGTGFLEKVYEKHWHTNCVPRASRLCSNVVSRCTTMT